MCMLTAVFKKGYVDGGSKNAYVLKRKEKNVDGGIKNAYVDSDTKKRLK